MNSNMNRPENETEDLLISITKNCETVIQQTQKKPQKTLDLKFTKPRETIQFNPPNLIEGFGMIRFTINK